jgi:ABC-2 type transport system permease protein
MPRRLAGLIRKEFAQIFRDVPLVVILAWAFTGAIYSSGHGHAGDTLDVATAVYDMSRSPASREFLSHLQPPYFKQVAWLDQAAEVEQALERGTAAMVVVIPAEFQRDIDSRRPARIQVLTDGSLAVQATVAIGYLAAISNAYAVAVSERRVGPGTAAVVHEPRLNERMRIRFNPNMLSAWFAGLLELLNMCTIVSLLLTAANLIRERERGTMERLLVSPARPIEIFLAKIVPTVVLVLGLSAVSFGLVLGPAFGVPFRGSVLFFYTVTGLYVFAMTSMGIAIGLVARSMAQGIMIMILILQPMVFLSGAWNPPEAMSPWLRALSLLSPLRYFIDFGFGVILKGSGLSTLVWDVVGIAVLGTGLFVFSLVWFERSLTSR